MGCNRLRVPILPLKQAQKSITWVDTASNDTCHCSIAICELSRIDMN